MRILNAGTTENLYRRVFLALFLLAACTNAPDGSTSVPPLTAATTTSPVPTTVATTNPTTTTATLPALVTELPSGPCELGLPPEGGEVTFAVANRLYGVLPDGNGVRCLLEADQPVGSMEWSPTGDRMIIDGRIYPADPALTPPQDGWLRLAEEWTRPTGQGVVFSASNRGGASGPLVKVKPGEVVDLSASLPDAERPVYHPAGTHLAVSSDPGVWLITNDGSAAVLLAADESATISDYQFDANGDLVFVASHAEGYHLHKLLAGSEGSLESPVLAEHNGWVGSLRASAFAPLIAYDEMAATCSPRLGIIGIEVPAPFDALGSRPVGWLPDDQLVVQAGRPDCLPLYSEVYVYSTGLCPGAPVGVVKLVSGVDSAAVRVVSPPPPPPPGSGIIESTAPA